MEDLGVDAMILIYILGYYCRREGIGWFYLPLEHAITNLLSHESSEILKMLLASQGQLFCLVIVTAHGRGRRRKKLLDHLKDRRGYSHLKEEALDRTLWRNRFGGGFEPVVRQNTE